MGCTNGGTEVLDILFEDGLLQEISNLQPDGLNSEMKFTNDLDTPEMKLVSV